MVSDEYTQSSIILVIKILSKILNIMEFVV